ncbi:MAG: ribosome biogenesis GTPase Der, partial [Deltaproteobacteria bacterium]|nr:ribosome biogenesis GTPase Der [Deltaproteobacteria bacterium]
SGKSTLFNRLTRSRAAIVDDEPGVTRDRHYGLVRTADPPFTLIDTAGFEPWAGEGLAGQVRAQVETALAEADAIIFLLDGRAGLAPVDEESAGLLMGRTQPVITVVNKLDSNEKYHLAAEFYALGLGEPIPVSAAHNLGINELIARVQAGLAQRDGPFPEEAAEEAACRVAILGRPNVGKSSLVNKIAGQERMVVSASPGTTRDAVDIRVEVGGRPYLLIDTAGLRRPGRVKPGVEKWSVLRALKAIDRSDAVVVLIDAAEELADQEARICGLAQERGRPVILALNKWDLIDEPDERRRQLEDQISRRIKFLAQAPVVTVSALTGRHIHHLFETVVRLVERYLFRAPTPQVNQVLERAVRRHTPPLVRGRRLKFYYATQVRARPPTFVVFTNRPDQVHFSYARFLTNQFKEAFGLEEIPIRVLFRPRGKEGRGRKHIGG